MNAASAATTDHEFYQEENLFNLRPTVGFTLASEELSA